MSSDRLPGSVSGFAFAAADFGFGDAFGFAGLEVDRYSGPRKVRFAANLAPDEVFRFSRLGFEQRIDGGAVRFASHYVDYALALGFALMMEK